MMIDPKPLSDSSESSYSPPQSASFDPTSNRDPLGSSGQHALPEGASRWNQGAESLGGAVGRAVRRVKATPEQLRSRFTVVSSRVREHTPTASDVKQGARQQWERVRTRVDDLVTERPLQAVAIVAGVGFLLGFAMRLGRDNRAR